MTPTLATTMKCGFDAVTFLATVGEGRTIMPFHYKETIYGQGEIADAVFYIHLGRVRLRVVSSTGKEATTGIFCEGEFFGEACLGGQPLRVASASAMTQCTLLRIDKKAMLEVLHREPALSDLFVVYLLGRNIRCEEDLIDHLFNSSEKRLARVLLLLARYGNAEGPAEVIPNITQELLAEMVGTTRPRVNFFLNRFRKRGFIDYAGGSALQVHSSLLNVVLHD